MVERNNFIVGNFYVSYYPSLWRQEGDDSNQRGRRTADRRPGQSWSRSWWRWSFCISVGRLIPSKMAERLLFPPVNSMTMPISADSKSARMSPRSIGWPRASSARTSSIGILVTTLGSTGETVRPHSLQNRASAGRFALQPMQYIPMRLLQLRQNFEPSGFLDWQSGHSIRVSLVYPMAYHNGLSGSL